MWKELECRLVWRKRVSQRTEYSLAFNKTITQTQRARRSGVHITGDIIDFKESFGVIYDLVVIDGIGGVRGDEGGDVRPQGLVLLHGEGNHGVADGPGGAERGRVIIHLQNVNDESR